MHSSADSINWYLTAKDTNDYPTLAHAVPDIAGLQEINAYLAALPLGSATVAQ